MSKEDGAKLPAHLEEMYQSEGGRDLFWDIAPMNRYNEHYHIEVRECCFEDISEIDTYKELQMLDGDYIVE
jgi:CTP:phosphocholine cytidylyltransferase-like protein